jgi:hypothetical protein
MPRKKGTRKKSPVQGTLSRAETQSLPVEEACVEYLSSAPIIPDDKEIHPRKNIPPVPEGPETPDETPTPSVELKTPPIR